MYCKHCVNKSWVPRSDCHMTILVQVHARCQATCIIRVSRHMGHWGRSLRSWLGASGARDATRDGAIYNIICMLMALINIFQKIHSELDSRSAIPSWLEQHHPLDVIVGPSPLLTTMQNYAHMENHSPHSCSLPNSSLSLVIVKNEKNLGVILCSDLKCDDHIATQTNKASMIMSI